MGFKIVTFLGERSRKPVEHKEMEAVKNVPPPGSSNYLQLDRLKKKQQINFRRFMTANAPAKELSPYIGCDRDALRRYIASKMIPGINWNNYGQVWVVDHIVPLRLFNLADPADLAIVWNYRNLMPLFKKDNLHKEGDLRFSLILLDNIDDGSEVIGALKKKAEEESQKMEKYLKVRRLISKAS